MQFCWASGFFFECENILISVSKAANRSSWYSLEIHSSKSSNVTSFHVLFTTSRVMGTFIPRNLSPSPYWPGPHLKKRDRPATCEGSWWESIWDRRVFAIKWSSFSYDANLVNFFEIEMFSASLSLVANTPFGRGKISGCICRFAEGRR